MRWQQFVRDYFSFSKKERKGIFLILAIIFILTVSPLLFPYIFKQSSSNYDDFRKDIASLSVKKNDSVRNKDFEKNFSDNNSNDSNYQTQNGEAIKPELFYFDPNTATYNDWRKLGIRDKTIHIIQNYLSKGGKFYKPEDVRKIWSLSSSDAERLIPYITIKDEPKQYESKKTDNKPYTPSLKTYSENANKIIDINTADTSELISLPGIGSKLSGRIIAFRNKLGGFYSIDQVAETYMLPDSTFQKIKPMLTLGNTSVNQININTATIDEMKSHPYIRYTLANAIFQYRQQHGNFNSVEDVKKIMSVTDDMYHKASPYLTIHD